jgi:hypothetical protein
MARMQCTGKTKAGAPCRAPAGPNGLCFLHANPDRAKTLGQLGGLGNRRCTGFDVDVPDNMHIGDVRNLEVQAVRGLLSGQLKARDATALVQLCNSLHRIIPAVDLETRIAALEKAVAQWGNEVGFQNESVATEIAATGSGAEHANVHTGPLADACSSEASNPPDESESASNDSK